MALRSASHAAGGSLDVRCGAGRIAGVASSAADQWKVLQKNLVCCSLSGRHLLSSGVLPPCKQTGLLKKRSIQLVTVQSYGARSWAVLFVGLRRASRGIPRPCPACSAASALPTTTQLRCHAPPGSALSVGTWYHCRGPSGAGTPLWAKKKRQEGA